MPCHCKDCAEELVQTYSEAHRHACEVRDVMRRFRTKAQIAGYLEGVEKRRGFDAMQKLRMDLLKAWRSNDR